MLGWLRNDHLPIRKRWWRRTRRRRRRRRIAALILCAVHQGPAVAGFRRRLSRGCPGKCTGGIRLCLIDIIRMCRGSARRTMTCKDEAFKTCTETKRRSGRATEREREGDEREGKGVREYAELREAD
jgi:hypothetical protein